MTISVVICTNKKLFASRSLIQKLLRSTSDLDEILIIHDREVDEVIYSKVRKKIRYVSANVKNISRLRNVGLRLATNDIILFIDDDILISMNLVKNIKNTFKKKLSYDAIFPQVERRNKKNIWSLYAEIDYHHWYYNRKVNAQLFAFPTGIFAIRKNSINTSFLFNSELSSGEDIDFTTRLSEAGKKLFFIPKITVKHEYVTTFKDFVKKRNWYAKHYASLAINLDGLYLVEHFLPTKKWQVFFPFYIYIKSFIYLYSRMIRFGNRNRLYLMLPSLVDAFVSTATFRSTKNGQKLIKQYTNR